MAKVTRFRTCPYCGDLHATNAWPANHLPPQYDLRSDLRSPRVIRDALDDVKSPLTWKPYDSKRALRRHYREHDVIEVGDEKVTPRRFDPDENEIAQDIKDACDQLTQNSLSNDEMANMLRSDAPVVGGLTVV